MSLKSHMNGNNCKAPRPPTLHTTTAVPCPGATITWDRADFWQTYPFHKHGAASKRCPGYSFVTLDPIKIRSNFCVGTVQSIDGVAAPCSKCVDSCLEVNVFREHASRPFNKIHTEEDLNNLQLRAKLAGIKLNHIQTLNLVDSLTRARDRLADFTEIFDFIGTNTVPALHRIFWNAYHEEWGIKTFREKVKLAAAGKYKARSYSQYEIDLAILLYELGGAGAVHAMNHSIFILPSLTTIQPHRRRHKIIPSVDGLSFTDISNNISALFGSQTDKMGGFCQEHLSALDTIKVGRNTETVEAAVTAVKEGRVHIAPEASVGAISHLSRTNYGARPVLISSTCKKGTWKDCLRTMLTVAEAWKRSPDGEARHGPLLSVASDGDPKRRVAIFVMCMHSEILPGNPLYPFVENLPGLNRRVGKDNLTEDFDPKHELKRLCTSLCSPQGVAVKGVCINRDLLLHWLERLPATDWSETTIHALLNPKDAQSVSRAVKLLLSIVALGTLDADDFDPTEAAEHEALRVLGEVFEALLQPMINPNLSLSEQIESLIKFSHLICALYLENKDSFLSHQLYGDLQATVKNAVLMVPKTRLINGKLGVYICLLGDDVLKTLFGRSRMIGGHSPNCSLGELRDRFVSAINLGHVYTRHPELERKPRRLKLLRNRDVDHLTPEGWRGEVSAESCDLNICWPRAVKSAEVLLRRYNVHMAVSFSELFKRRNTDLMRPFGTKYPAISTEVDRSMVNLSADPSLDKAPEIDPATVNPNNPLLYMDFDEMIARETAQDIAMAESGPHSLFAEIDSDGHLTHKKSVLRVLFDMTHDSHVSHDRTLRVRGYTMGGKTWQHESADEQSPTSSTHFALGNIFTTLICYNNTHLGLAVAKCTLIKRCVPGTKAVSISAVPYAELCLASAPYLISGQVLSLIPVDPMASEWVWDGQFVSFSQKKKGAAVDDVARIRNLQFTVSSQLIDAAIHKCARETSISEQENEVDCEREKTWIFSDKDIRLSWDRLWTTILPNTSLHDKLPTKFTGVSAGVFPYQAPPAADFNGIFYSLPIAGTSIEQSYHNRKKCRMCNKEVKDTDRQTHIGQHILKALRGVAEPGIILPVTVDYPCGTCGGRSTSEACSINIKSGKAESNCPAAYAFQISAASTCRKNRPCTNVPVQCPLGCEEIHWKYNFPQHLQERHPSWPNLLSSSFTSQVEISRDEQEWLGIPAPNITDLPYSQIQSMSSPISQPICGEKRPLDVLQESPSRRDKENANPAKSMQLDISATRIRPFTHQFHNLGH
ncbi:hypothetical protein K438DRAFT_2051185 [Mycena galopus ATCC 62051]|nr:hypothetical protein K438DRAFT_2051185 [Mycena galopus ATCC 62051]